MTCDNKHAKCPHASQNTFSLITFASFSASSFYSCLLKIITQKAIFSSNYVIVPIIDIYMVTYYYITCHMNIKYVHVCLVIYLHIHSYKLLCIIANDIFTNDLKCTAVCTHILILYLEIRYLGVKHSYELENKC
jgi:hypothetical protein